MDSVTYETSSVSLLRQLGFFLNLFSFLVGKRNDGIELIFCHSSNEDVIFFTSIDI